MFSTHCKQARKSPTTPIFSASITNDLPDDVTSAESLATFPQDTPVQEVFSWLLAGHQLTVSGGPSSIVPLLRPPKKFWLVDWFIEQ